MEANIAGWEEFTLSSKMVNLKDARPGDNWDGFFIRIFDGSMGQLIELKHPESGSTIIPYSGVIRKIFEEKMEVSKYDYLRIGYLGDFIIEKGKWSGKKCWDFKVSRNVLLSGEAKYREMMLGIDAQEDIATIDEVKDLSNQDQNRGFAEERKDPSEKKTLTEQELDEFLNGL